MKHGKELFDSYGYLNPFIGFLFAFVAAVIAIRWMVTYLRRHGLEIFGWYRLLHRGRRARVVDHERGLNAAPIATRRPAPSLRC